MTVRGRYKSPTYIHTRVPAAVAVAAAVGQFGVDVVGMPIPDNFIKRLPLPHVARSRHDVAWDTRGLSVWRRRRVQRAATAATAKITPRRRRRHNTRAARPEHATSQARACPSKPLDGDWPKKPHVKKIKSIIE